jgi:low molecular weight protein-tyrosine phosphatase
MLKCVTPPPLPAPRDADGPYRVCLICLGNICRSPMAEVVLRSSVDRAGLSSLVVVDSAGTGDWHLGQRMNSGARSALARRGYDGSGHRARQIDASWFPSRDLVLAMDRSNLLALRRMGGEPERVRLFGDVAGSGSEVPDPYGRGPADFDRVLAQLEAAAPEVTSLLARMVASPSS